MSSCAEAVTTLTTVIASGLFIISEILPYIQSVKGDGIIQIVINILKAKLKKDGIKIDEETPISTSNPIPIKKNPIIEYTDGLNQSIEE